MDFLSGGEEHAGQGDDILAKLSKLGVRPGSPEAVKAWADICDQAHSPAMVAKAKAAGFEHATGWYKGGALWPGHVGPGETDYQFLVDKLVATKGYSVSAATKIAAAAKMKIYGGQ